MDLIRHLSIFDPSKFTGTVGIIGVGALGSAVALQVAKLGIERIVLWDDDKVEAHNLPNQVLYGPDAVGHAKAAEAVETISALTGTFPNAIFRKVEGRQQLREHGITHVFVCVDSMAARKSIFQNCVYLNPDVVCFAEGRLSSTNGMSTVFNPTQVGKSKEYVKRLYPDSDVVHDRGACGNILMLGATAMMLACQMTWQFINHCNGNAYSEEMSMNYKDMNVEFKGMLVGEDTDDDD